MFIANEDSIRKSVFVLHERYRDLQALLKTKEDFILTLLVIVIKVLVLDEFKVIIVKIFLDFSFVILNHKKEIKVNRFTFSTYTHVDVLLLNNRHC